MKILRLHIRSIGIISYISNTNSLHFFPEILQLINQSKRPEPRIPILLLRSSRGADQYVNLHKNKGQYWKFLRVSLIFQALRRIN